MMTNDDCVKGKTFMQGGILIWHPHLVGEGVPKRQTKDFGCVTSVVQNLYVTRGKRVKSPKFFQTSYKCRLKCHKADADRFNPVTRPTSKQATRAVMIPIFLEPIPEPVPQTKGATTGADSTLESVPAVEPTPILESAPIVEPAPKYGNPNLT